MWNPQDLYGLRIEISKANYLSFHLELNSAHICYDEVKMWQPKRRLTHTTIYKILIANINLFFNQCFPQHCHPDCSSLYTLTWVCIFSILFSVHFLRHRQGEFFWQSKFLNLVIISFIFVILMNDSAVLL